MLGLALIFFLCYLSLCFNNNIWTDEAFTIELLHSDFAGILKGTASDVHPPLYYLIAKCVTLVFGDSLLCLKLVSILPMFLCMSWGALIVRKRFGFRAAVLYPVLLGVIPCTMEYAVQVRMYSWAIFFITFMALWAYEAYLEQSLRFYAGIVLTSAAAAYTHYFAFVSAILIYGFLFLALLAGKRRELLKWLAAVAASLLLFAPWMPYMELQVKGVSRNYWIEEITGETIKAFFPFLFDMSIPGTTALWMGLLAVSLFFAVRMMLSARRGQKEEAGAGLFALLCLLVPVGTALTGITASALIRPVFIVRYLLPCMGLAALFLAITLSRYADGMVYGAMIFFFLCAGLVDYKQSVNGPIRRRRKRFWIPMWGNVISLPTITKAISLFMTITGAMKKRCSGRRWIWTMRNMTISGFWIPFTGLHPQTNIWRSMGFGKLLWETTESNTMILKSFR